MGGGGSTNRENPLTQFPSYFRFPTSHTTVHAVPHTAVPILGAIRDTPPLRLHTQLYIDVHLL